MSTQQVPTQQVPTQQVPTQQQTSEMTGAQQVSENKDDLMTEEDANYALGRLDEEPEPTFKTNTTKAGCFHINHSNLSDCFVINEPFTKTITPTGASESKNTYTYKLKANVTGKFQPNFRVKIPDLVFYSIKQKGDKEQLFATINPDSPSYYKIAYALKNLEQTIIQKFCTGKKKGPKDDRPDIFSTEGFTSFTNGLYFVSYQENEGDPYPTRSQKVNVFPRIADFNESTGSDGKTIPAYKTQFVAPKKRGEKTIIANSPDWMQFLRDKTYVGYGELIVTVNDIFRLDNSYYLRTTADKVIIINYRDRSKMSTSEDDEEDITDLVDEETFQDLQQNSESQTQTSELPVGDDDQNIKMEGFGDGVPTLGGDAPEGPEKSNSESNDILSKVNCGDTDMHSLSQDEAVYQ